jgi:hypothetical protein|tara:strand:- start:9761 stop:12298 length:2538 start_codon:yes stop_codon:yes gene_type:complete
MAEDEQRNLPHIYLPNHGEREDFTSPRSGGGGPVPQRNREQHAHHLEEMLTAAVAAAQERIANRDPEISGGTPGFYLEFELLQTQQAVLDKLEYQGRERIELVTARPSTENPDLVKATVFVPESRREYYLHKVRAYADEDNVRYEKDAEGNIVLDERGIRVEKSRRPKNQALVAALETARIAEAGSLYTDDLDLFPEAGQEVWWEVWLRRDCRPIFDHAARQLDVAVKEHSVTFAEREVILARAAPETIGRIVANTDAIAELRLARDTPSLFIEMDGAQQIAWAQELADRVVAPGDNAPAVCVLDSGSTRRHPLIAPALAEDDQQAWHVGWHGEDVSAQWRGHGTQLSGTALYGDLIHMLLGNGPVELHHRLESVKILPDHGDNDPDLYGYITAAAMGRAEVIAPERARAYCLAVTCPGDHWRGRPSSWSAKLDDLAYGDGEDERLIVISAGNIRTYYPSAEYLDQNDTAPIESPAQSWNALTVGAVTEKITVTHRDFAGWQVMAPAGDLSPSSRTSVNWRHDWPIKPDVVFEGGNQGVDPATGNGDHIDDLALLTTYNRPEERAFTVTGETSAATAQVARLAAQVLSERPALWPETVRALIVHSAEWTPAMLGHLPANPNKSDQRLVLRRYGYGVPSLDRALRSFNSDVTLVVESDLQPYQLERSRTRSRDMMLHDLPWPIDTLNALGETPVEMRVTLSYFVEPNPGERGWTKRHRYGGHGLRFSVKRPEESVDRFRRRVNAAAGEEDERVGPVGNDEGWVLGPQLRDRGSIHSDVWRGTAVDLANRHAIGIFPIGGWWREKPKLERADRRVRYALIVSLRASEEIDIYTEIANAVGIEIDVET